MILPEGAFISLYKLGSRMLCCTFSLENYRQAICGANTAGKPSTDASEEQQLGAKGWLVHCLVLDRAKMNETPDSLAGSTVATIASRSRDSLSLDHNGYQQSGERSLEQLLTRYW